jgi:hypothetical protein
VFAEFTNIVHDSSGFFTFVMSANGTFSGSLVMGRTYPMTGQFDSSGFATVSVPRPGTNALSVVMALDLTTNFAETVLGTVSDGNWSANLTGDRAPFNAVSDPAPQAGRYTLVLAGSNISTNPAGHGYGTMTVDTTGKVKFAGTLADGTVISHSASISRGGKWPFYVSLYKGQGSVLGLCTFTNSGTYGVNGGFAWNKDASTNAIYYPSGFNFTSAAVGSTFTPPASGNRVLDVASGFAALDEGGLLSQFSSGFALSSNNVVTVDAPATNGLSGVINGSFTHPETGRKSTLKGVILQQTTNAYGFFLSTNESGSFILQ